MTDSSTEAANDGEFPPLAAGIGPHENREYNLMSLGKKHLAMFWDIVPYEFFANPLGIQYRRLCHDRSMTTIFYRLGHLDDAQKLMELTTGGHRFDADVERQIGRLLGYEEWQIDAFLAHVGAR